MSIQNDSNFRYVRLRVSHLFTLITPERAEHLSRSFANHHVSYRPLPYISELQQQYHENQPGEARICEEKRHYCHIL